MYNGLYSKVYSKLYSRKQFAFDCGKNDGEKTAKLDWNGGQGRNRTADTRIFSPLLYRLSYLSITASTNIAPARKFFKVFLAPAFHHSGRQAHGEATGILSRRHGDARPFMVSLKECNGPKES